MALPPIFDRLRLPVIGWQALSGPAGQYETSDGYREGPTTAEYDPAAGSPGTAKRSASPSL